MCADKEELKREMANAKKGIPHSHVHSKEDAARLRDLHKQVRQEEAEATVTVGHAA